MSERNTYAEMQRVGWERHEHTTRCSDPTVVVSWSIKLSSGVSLKITEFQNIYTVERNGVQVPERDEIHEVGVKLHKMGEQAYYSWLSSQPSVLDRYWE